MVDDKDKLSNAARTRPESRETSADAQSTVFADESGTSSIDDWYGIGALVIRDEKLNRFESWLTGLREKYGVGGELKWKDIGTSYAPINLAIDLLTGLLQSSAYYATIVVHKPSYRHWRDNPEKAFYITYTQLLQHLRLSTIVEGTSRTIVEGCLALRGCQAACGGSSASLRPFG